MDALRNRIGQIAQSVNGESDHSNMDTRAYNNPTKSQNMNGESQQPGGKSDGQDPAGAPSGSSSRGSMAANAIHGAAEQSLSNIINQIAEAAANRQAEAERTQELNQEGKDISLSDYGLDSNISVSVSRAEDVSGENIKVYEGLENDVIGASRGLTARHPQSLERPASRRKAQKSAFRPAARGHIGHSWGWEILFQNQAPDRKAAPWRRTTG